MGEQQDPALVDPHDDSIGDIVEPRRIPLASVHLEVVGNVEAGRPVTVEAVVRSRDHPVSAQLSVFSPEMERATTEVFRTAEGRRPSRPRTSSRSAQTVQLGPGEVHRERTGVAFDEPGLYTISAELVLDPGVPDAERGAYDGFDGDRLWVWVAESGSRVLERPDLSVVPDEFVGTLGPTRRLTESPAFVAPAPGGWRRGGRPPPPGCPAMRRGSSCASP